jgi:SAM-dependent methyltransferase
MKYMRNYFRNILKQIRKSKNGFPGSSAYWESRYLQGGNSGAGSYNRLAEFKAKILNDFCAKNNIEKVIEFGCGDGNQLTLAKYNQYIGLDVSQKSIEICNEKFKNDLTKEFYSLNSTNLGEAKFKSDLVISLDVIFHLVEDDVFNTYMGNLFNVSSKYVIIYSSNYEAKTNVSHVRHRHFTDYIEKKYLNFKLINFIKNQYPFDANDPNNTSFADFYFFEKTK